jgi:hypothetical protein
MIGWRGPGPVAKWPAESLSLANSELRIAPGIRTEIAQGDFAGGGKRPDGKAE